MPLRSWTAVGATIALSAAVTACGADYGPAPHSTAPVVTVPAVTASPSSPSQSPSRSSSPTVTPASPSTIAATTSASVAPPTPSEVFPVDASMAAEFPDAAAKIPDAVQVVRDFYAGVNHEIDTGDEAAVLRTYQASSCIRCASQVVEIKDLLAGGNTIRGGRLHIVSIDAVWPPGDGEIFVAITDTQDSGAQVALDGKVIKEIPAVSPTQLVFEVSLGASPYVIDQVIKANP